MCQLSLTPSLCFQVSASSFSRDCRLQLQTMASIILNLPPPPLLISKRQPFLRTFGKFNFSASAEIQGRVAIVAKATSESPESSTSLSIIKSVRNIWDTSEDRVAFIGLGFAAIVAFWASVNLVTAIDKVPFIPSILELIGILFSSWFIYRYLLFKPDREELFEIINKSIADILGQ